MLVLWSRTINKQRSEGSFAGLPVLYFQEYTVLPAQDPHGEALRC
jgi:hypothetical protein